MIQKGKLLLLLLSLPLLLGFRYILGPQINDISFERLRSGGYQLSLHMSQPVEYEIKQIDDKTLEIFFNDEIVWDAQMEWRDDTGRMFLRAYRAAQNKFKRNFWSLKLQFRTPVEVRTHHIEENVDGRVNPETGEQEELHLLGVEVIAVKSGKDGETSGASETYKAQRSVLNNAVMPTVNDITESFDVVDGTFKVIMHMNAPVDFDVQLDASETRVTAVAPAEMVWSLQPLAMQSQTSRKVLKSFEIEEAFEDGKDRIKLTFKAPILLQGAFAVGTTFVIQGDIQNYEAPENVDEDVWDEGRIEDVKKYARSAKLKEVRVQELTDVTWIDFRMTDKGTLKAFQEYDGDLVVTLPLTVWDEVDADEMQQKGLFLGYEVQNNKQLEKTKVRIAVQKGAKIQDVQSVEDGGFYITRIVLVADPSMESPDWLVQYGVEELPMYEEEREAVSAKHLVYRGGIYERATIGSRFSLGVGLEYLSGGVFREGATQPAYSSEEPSISVTASMPIWSREELALDGGVRYLKATSGLQEVINFSLRESFYKDQENAMALDSELYLFGRLLLPVGSSAMVYGRVGFGTGWFLDYSEDKNPMVVRTDPSKLWSFALGCEVALTDQITLEMALGYDCVESFSSPYDSKELFNWSSFATMFGLKYMLKPMAGPSAESSKTFVNKGFYAQVGTQMAHAHYSIDVEDNQHIFDRSSRVERHLMPGWTFGVGYLFMQNTISFAAELEVGARDYRVDKIFYEHLDETMIDIVQKWDVGLLLKPGLSVNHGVRAYVLLGGTQRWCEQTSGPKIQETLYVENDRRALLTEGVGTMRLLGAIFGLGLELNATKNFSLGFSCAYQRFPEHNWIDHLETVWKVGSREQVFRLHIAYNL